MKTARKSGWLKYVLLCGGLAALMALTFLLPVLSGRMYDRRMENGYQTPDMDVNMYEVRRIPLEERLLALAEALENGETPIAIRLADKGEMDPTALCEAVNREVEAAEDLWIFRCLGGFPLDEEHLCSYAQYNLIAGYSSQLQKLSWDAYEGDGSWGNITVWLDGETQKILFVGIESSRYYTTVRMDKLEDGAVKTTIFDIYNGFRTREQLAEGWCRYLGFGEWEDLPAEKFYEGGEAAALYGEGQETYRPLGNTIFWMDGKKACLGMDFEYMVYSKTINMADVWQGFTFFFELDL